MLKLCGHLAQIDLRLDYRFEQLAFFLLDVMADVFGKHRVVGFQHV